ELAEKLHAQYPEHYPDTNHKPELAIALTPFEGLCGFRPVEEIVAFLQHVPEFRALIGNVAAEQLERSGRDDPRGVTAALRVCFTRMMKSEKKVFVDHLNQLVKRISQEALVNLNKISIILLPQTGGSLHYSLLRCVDFNSQNPPVSLMSVSSLFSPDCIECMACSDNTVRAGLTPKFIDVLTLCEMLNYTPAPASSKLLLPAQSRLDPCVSLYDPPIPDFAVMRIEIPSPIKLYLISAIDSASILLTVQGSAVGTSTAATSEMILRPGTVLFISANESVSLHFNSPEGMLLFRACCLL
ncbi:PREDICTED: mannose-6-phosphate isomerase, partial [Thamnophis sirtalis]|uniref:Mannose-6-phosphate isomerase n=1 Tax=Thamnophis sirtalis TaxID=35019 RepID=A0A6I9YEM8_9SAUR